MEDIKLELEPVNDDCFYLYINKDDSHVSLKEIGDNFQDRMFFTRELYPELLREKRIYAVVGLWFRDKIETVVMQDDYRFYLPNQRYTVDDLINDIFIRLDCHY